MQAKTIPSYIPSYGILLLVVLSAVLIAWVPGKSLLFLVFLLLNIALCILNRKFFTHSSLVAFRTLVGLVFVFSSLSKGVDPTGTAYMIEDYLEAYRLPWLSFLAVPGSFLLNLVEFCIGIFLLFNVHFKLTVWVLALMMAVTTLSLPSLIMLRKAVKPRLLAAFIGVCTLGIIVVGYLFNLFQWIIL